jgi:hypothetical protein
MMVKSNHIELTQAQLVQRIGDGARARLDMTAQEMIRAFQNNELEDLGSVLDLLGFAAMLDTNHPLYVDL